jgi:hypothetical protein
MLPYAPSRKNEQTKTDCFNSKFKKFRFMMQNITNGHLAKGQKLYKSKQTNSSKNQNEFDQSLPNIKVMQ